MLRIWIGIVLMVIMIILLWWPVLKQKSDDNKCKKNGHENIQTVGDYGYCRWCKKILYKGKII